MTVDFVATGVVCILALQYILEFIPKILRKVTENKINTWLGNFLIIFVIIALAATGYQGMRILKHQLESHLCDL